MPATKIKRSAIGIIWNKEDRLLLIKRRDVPIWVLPGGGVESQESPEEAVLREVLEETGLQVRICRQVALYTPLNNLANDTYVFECEPVAGGLSTGDETMQVGFYALEALPKPFFFLHHEWVQDAQKQLAHIIQRPLTQVTYWKLFTYFCRHPLQVGRFIFSRIGKPINTR